MGDLRYADAGVDIDEGNRAVSLIRRALATTHTQHVLSGVGGFSGLFSFDSARFHDAVLALGSPALGLLSSALA